MRKRRGLIFSTLTAGAVILLSGTANLASAQYLISARAGFVNYTTGPAMVRTGDDPSWNEITTQLHLQPGDHIKTEAWGKAELLLSPGSYLRIGQAAEVVVRSTDLSLASFDLLSGSAILEVGHLRDAVIMVQTPTTRVHIKKDGLYRITVTPDTTTLTVRKGEARFQQADGRLKKVKKKRTAEITAHEYHLAKLDHRQLDEFDLWSADRAETLLAANQSVLRRLGYWGRTSLYQSAWVYDPFFGFYTFFPWGYAFRSVYGYGYYAPWYYGGYWSGGFYPGGGGGSTRPTPPRRHKPKFSSRTVGARRVRGSLRVSTASRRSYGPSTGFSRPASRGSYRAPSVSVSRGHFGGSSRGGGVKAGVRVGGAHRKVH